jgi:hypothetical protein
MPTVSLGAPNATTLLRPVQICQRPAIALAASDTESRADKTLVGQEASTARPPLPPLVLLVLLVLVTAPLLPLAPVLPGPELEPEPLPELLLELPLLLVPPPLEPALLPPFPPS